MSNLTHIAKDITHCTICEKHLKLGVNPVVQLDADARILIAGQAPGVKAHNSGVPFDDASGDRLRNWLGVSKEQFYDPKLFAILPMGFCYPGKGKSGDLAPRPECAPAWREKVLNELKQLELTLLIGQYAQAYHLGGRYQSVTESVQAWRYDWPKRVALPHPSPRNNIWLKKNTWFETDLLPALKEQVQGLIN